MEGAFYPGQHYSIKRDILVGGQVAFHAGQPVVLVKISTNPQRPEYQFVVYSEALGTSFQLRADDLGPPIPVMVPEQFNKPPAGPAVRPPTQQWEPRAKNRSIGLNKALFIALGIIVVVVLGFLGFKFLKGTGGPAEVTKKLFQFGQDRGLKGMLSTYDPTALQKDSGEANELQMYFISGGNTNAGPFGYRFTEVLNYNTTVTGETAKVVVSAPQQYFSQEMRSKYPMTNVPIADVFLINTNGKWMVTDFQFKL